MLEPLLFQLHPLITIFLEVKKVGATSSMPFRRSNIVFLSLFVICK
jgi:hypothetical protein